MTCEIHDYDRSAHAHTMRVIDIGSEISQLYNNKHVCFLFWWKSLLAFEVMRF